MKSRNANVGAGSLDMLLDTMCNTFGGVCFIALLIAILSAMLPKDAVPQEEAEPDVRKLVENERLALLQRQRDELRNAAKLQLELLESATNDTDAITVSEAELASDLAGKADSVRELRDKLREMEEEIARLSTSTEYNKAEAERLGKLAAELKRRIAEAEDARRRIVRTPLERDLSGVRPVTFWIKGGRLYDLENKGHCTCDEEGYGETKRWHYRVIAGAGWRVDDPFLASADFDAIARQLGGMKYARLYCDADSFGALCLLRDELVRRRCRYNWYLAEGPTLDFVVGNDERVQ